MEHPWLSQANRGQKACRGNKAKELNETSWTRRSILGYLKPAEVKKVRYTEALGLKELRAKLVCCLLMDGVFRKEIPTIALPDLRLEFRSIRFPRSVVTLSQHTVSVIEDWLEIRPSRSDNLTLITDAKGYTCQWHGTLEGEGRVMWSKKTVGRPVTCNEYLATHVREARKSYPLLTVEEVGRICRITRNKAKWLLGMDTKAVVNKY